MFAKFDRAHFDIAQDASQSPKTQCLGAMRGNNWVQGSAVHHMMAATDADNREALGLQEPDHLGPL